MCVCVCVCVFTQIPHIAKLSTTYFAETLLFLHPFKRLYVNE